MERIIRGVVALLWRHDPERPLVGAELEEQFRRDAEGVGDVEQHSHREIFVVLAILDAAQRALVDMRARRELFLRHAMNRPFIRDFRANLAEKHIAPRLLRHRLPRFHLAHIVPFPIVYEIPPQRGFPRR